MALTPTLKTMTGKESLPMLFKGDRLGRHLGMVLIMQLGPF